MAFVVYLPLLSFVVYSPPNHACWIVVSFLSVYVICRFESFQRHPNPFPIILCWADFDTDILNRIFRGLSLTLSLRLWVFFSWI